MYLKSILNIYFGLSLFLIPVQSIAGNPSDSSDKNKEFEKFFAYKLESNYKAPSGGEVVFYENNDIIRHFTIKPKEPSSICKRIDFVYFNNRLLSYSIECSEGVDIDEKIKFLFGDWTDKSFVEDGYFVWSDNKVYIVYDFNKNVVTIGKNNYIFFYEGLQRKLTYSPFIKEGKWNEVYKKWKLNQFSSFCLAPMSFFGVESLKPIKEVGLVKYTVFLPGQTEIEYSDKSGIDDTTIYKPMFESEEKGDTILLKRENGKEYIRVGYICEMVFYDSLLFNYNLIFKDQKSFGAVALDIKNRFGKPSSVDNGEYIWHKSTELITLKQEKDRLIFSVSDLRILNTVQNYLSTNYPEVSFQKSIIN